MTSKLKVELEGSRDQAASRVLPQRAQELVRALVRRALERHRYVLEDQEWAGILCRTILVGLARNGVVLADGLRDLPLPAPTPTGPSSAERVEASRAHRAQLKALQRSHKEKSQALREVHLAERARLERRLTRLQREASEQKNHPLRGQRVLEVLETRVRELVLKLVREGGLLPPQGDPLGYHQGLESFRQDLGQTVHDVVRDEGGALLESLERGAARTRRVGPRVKDRAPRASAKVTRSGS